MLGCASPIEAPLVERSPFHSSNSRAAPPSRFAQADIEESSRQFFNPLTDVWFLKNKFVYQELTGDRLPGRDKSLVGIFQPTIPIELPGDWVWVSRLTAPIVLDAPTPGSVPGSFEDENSIPGDLQYLGVFGRPTPNLTQGASVLALGLSAVLPTASEDALATTERLALGPGLLYADFREHWILGTIVQHGWNIGGDSDDEYNRSSVQWLYLYSLGDGWQVGASPIWRVDWKAASDDRWTVPLAMGIHKTIKIGKVPVKFSLEYHYSVFRPDSVGVQHSLNFEITPIIPALFDGWN